LMTPKAKAILEKQNIAKLKANNSYHIAQ